MNLTRRSAEPLGYACCPGYRRAPVPRLGDGGAQPRPAMGLFQRAAPFAGLDTRTATSPCSSGSRRRWSGVSTSAARNPGLTSSVCRDGRGGAGHRDPLHPRRAGLTLGVAPRHLDILTTFAYVSFSPWSASSWAGAGRWLYARFATPTRGTRRNSLARATVDGTSVPPLSPGTEKTARSIAGSIPIREGRRGRSGCWHACAVLDPLVRCGQPYLVREEQHRGEENQQERPEIAPLPEALNRHHQHRDQRTEW